MKPGQWSLVDRVALLLVVAAAAAAPASAQVRTCAANGTGGGDLIDRGFYIQNYNGGNVGTVQVRYYTSGAAGSYTVTLTMHSGTYDGTVLGSQSVTTTLPASGGTDVTFGFGGVAVPAGTTLAFVQTLVSSPPGASLFFDTGTCGLGDAGCTACPGFVETEATTAPLDTFRRGSVGVTVTAAALAGIPALGAWGAAALIGAVLALGLLAARRLAP